MQLETAVPLKPMLVGVTPSASPGQKGMFNLGVQLFDGAGKDVTKDIAQVHKLPYSAQHNAVKLPAVGSQREAVAVLKSLGIQDTFSQRLQFPTQQKEVQKGPSR